MKHVDSVYLKSHHGTCPGLVLKLQLQLLDGNISSSNSNCNFSTKPGPLLDDGAPYLAIGVSELEILMELNGKYLREEL